MEDKVLETVVNGLEYSFEKDILVKPLAPIMVTKEYTEQIPTGEKDEEGFNKYEVKTHTKEVESDFAKGIVLSIPTGADSTIKVGDTIVSPTLMVLSAPVGIDRTIPFAKSDSTSLV